MGPRRSVVNSSGSYAAVGLTLKQEVLCHIFCGGIMNGQIFHHPHPLGTLHYRDLKVKKYQRLSNIIIDIMAKNGATFNHSIRIY